MPWMLSVAGHGETDRGIIMAEALGKPLRQPVPEDITSRFADACKRLGELSSETLEKIEEIEANARVSEQKSGSIILR